jgi:hypothetical protein
LGATIKTSIVGLRLDKAVMHVETVRKQHRFAWREELLDLFVVDFGLQMVLRQNLNHVSALGGFFGGNDFHAFGFRQIERFAWARADDDVDTRIAQTERLPASLRTIADHGDCFAFQNAQIGVAVVVNVWHSLIFLLYFGRRNATPDFARSRAQRDENDDFQSQNPHFIESEITGFAGRSA